MKHAKLLWIVGIIIFSFLAVIGMHFYKENVLKMHTQAKKLLIQTLVDELQRKKKDLNVPYISYAATTDTIPLTICVTTEKGISEYKVDVNKNKKNISQSSRERFLHSMLCLEYPLLPDTVQRYWIEALHSYRIYLETAVQISETDFDSEIHVYTSENKNNHVFSEEDMTFYIGARCEVKVIGFTDYTWWAVFLYDWRPFIGLVTIAFILILLSILYWSIHRLPKVRVVEKCVVREVEIIREVIKEVPYKVVKGSNDLKVNIYELCPGLIFDAHKQILLLDSKEIKLAPQSCAILKIFLDAPNLTLSDDALLQNIWGTDSTVTIKRFTVASSRLCNALSDVGFSVAFKRVGYNQYRMIFADNQ